MPVRLYQARAEFFRILCHPVRIWVLELLQDGQCRFATSSASR
jgi:ArsR family transcriptional regulator